MFGIPFTVIRESDVGGMIETIYLRTYRRGPLGDEMRKAIKAYHDATNGQNRAAAQVPIILGKATKLSMEETNIEAMEKLAAEQDAAIEQSTQSGRDALQAAEKVAEVALRENYGEKTEAVLDRLTDRELNAIVGTVEMGAMPKDFFQWTEDRRKQISTGPSGAAPELPSSQPASPAQTSSPEK
jgi:hypothetical protein